MTRAYKLSPIMQRLKLYGFATVMLHPRCKVNPQRWGILDLQALALQRPWQGLFSDCLDYRPLGLAPVISHSLQKLITIRHRQPLRPLIYARTAFAKETTANHLRKLVTYRNLLAHATAKDDCLQPLYWGPTIPSANGQTLLAYAHIQDHPLHERKLWYIKNTPGLAVVEQEDGQPLLQFPLFSGVPSLKSPQHLETAQQILDCRFLEHYANLPAHCYILAEDKSRLLWFRQDCIRLLGPRVCLWNYPQHPDPRDPLQHFILTCDRQIRFDALQDHFGILHLDGTHRHYLYRSARMTSGNAHWVAIHQSHTGATYHGGDALYQFVHNGQSWYSTENARSPSADASEHFEERVLMLAHLKGVG